MVFTHMVKSHMLVFLRTGAAMPFVVIFDDKPRDEKHVFEAPLEQAEAMVRWLLRHGVKTMWLHEREYEAWRHHQQKPHDGALRAS
jgi:hypothetical protein